MARAERFGQGEEKMKFQKGDFELSFWLLFFGIVVIGSLYLVGSVSWYVYKCEAGERRWKKSLEQAEFIELPVEFSFFEKEGWITIPEKITIKTEVKNLGGVTRILKKENMCKLEKERRWKGRTRDIVLQEGVFECE
jgi:hypothetical protein